jgi:hypothetical protein
VTEILSPAGQQLDRALQARGLHSTVPDCRCEFADVGAGPWMKVAEFPDCPACTLPGFAAWALEHGLAGEKSAAQLYLREWEAEMSAQAMDEAAAQEQSGRLLFEGQYAEWSGMPSGRYVWLAAPGGRDAKIHGETNWMAQAAPGAVTNGYVKTDQKFAGLAVWERAA